MFLRHIFYTCGIPYSSVCGRAIGYAYNRPDAFASGNGIDGVYVEGLSITHGHPRKHIWTYAAGYSENHNNNDWNCPCAARPGPAPPSFVGSNYHCESGNIGSPEAQWYTADKLWDGQTCIAGSNCCSTTGLPWFCRTLPCETADDIEVRLCCDQTRDNEDVGIELLKIFVI